MVYYVKRIDRDLLDETIRRIYRVDFEHLVEVHKFNERDGLDNEQLLEAFIKDTLNSIMSVELYFGLFSGDEIVGYFTIMQLEKDTALNGIHILPEHRNKEALSALWDYVYSISKGVLMFAVFSNNVKMKNHIKKQGFVMMKPITLSKYKHILLLYGKLT